MDTCELRFFPSDLCYRKQAHESFTYRARDVCAKGVGHIFHGYEEACCWERVDLREGLGGVEEEEELDRGHVGLSSSWVVYYCILRGLV